MAQTASIIYIVGIIVSILLFILFLVFYLREQPDRRNNLWLILSIVAGVLFLVFAALSLYELFKPKQYSYPYPLYVEQSPNMSMKVQSPPQSTSSNMKIETSIPIYQGSSQPISRNISPMTMETSTIPRQPMTSYEGSPLSTSRTISPQTISNSLNLPSSMSPSPQFYSPVSSPSQLYRQ